MEEVHLLTVVYDEIAFPKRMQVKTLFIGT